MNDGRSTVRHTDLAARVAMLVSGWCAIAAMWTASERSIYPMAAAVLATATALAAVPVLRRVGVSSRARIALVIAKTACCAALFAICLTTGAFGAVRLNGHQPGAHQPGGASSVVATFGALLVVALVAQVATIGTRRDVALGTPIICAMLVQAGMAARDASVAPAFAVSLTAMVVAVALVYRAELLHEATAVVAKPVGRRHAGGAAAVQVGSVAAIGALVFVLLPNSLHLGTHPAAQHTAAIAPTEGTAASAAKSVAGGGDPHSTAIADPATGALDLRVRGPLSAQPVFVVSSSSPAYWQGAVYDHYDGTSWTTTGSTATAHWTVTPVAGSAVRVQQAPPDPERPAGAEVQQRTDSVQIVSEQLLHTVFAPGRAMTYTGPGQVVVDADGNPRLEMSETAAPSSRDYDVVSTRALLPTGNSGSAASSGSADTAPGARWTQLPPQLPVRVKALADRLVGDGARTAPAPAVSAIDDYLRHNETYDLTAPVPAPGEDAVDDFLFVSHRGFCEQFASAAVVLLRSAGIPARVVTGYSQGDTSSSPGKRVMRGADAHAWIQVWYPGVGWIDDDPTASATAVAPAAVAPTVVTPAPAASPTPSAAPAARDYAVSAGLRHAVSRFPAGRIGLAAAAVLFVLVLRALTVFVGRRLRRRPPVEPAQRERVGGGAALQAYWRLDTALSAMGRPREPGETLREIAIRLDGLTAPADQLGMALDLLERECYGIEPLTEVETTAAVAVFDSLSDELRLLHETQPLRDTTPA